MEWDGEQEREREWEEEREGKANRLVEELEELLSSPSEQAPDDLRSVFDEVGADSFPASFNELQLQNVRTIMNREQPSGAQFHRIDSTIYREKLRSYSSFPSSTSSPAAALSDTSSQCTNTDMIGIIHDQSLSDYDGNCRRLRPQARQRRVSTQSKGMRQADQHFVDATHCGLSRRSYECDVCGKFCHSPQSLGGHKNIHRSKGNNSSLRRRSLAAPIVDHVGGQAGSTSNSSESETVSSLYKGVRCREGDKFVTEIRPPRSSEKWWLGTFPSAEEAAQAYDVALAFFKSESELNFGYHPLYLKFPPLPPDLSPHKYAQHLRVMVKEISEQIIAERRRSEEQAAYPSSTGGHAVSPAGSSSSTADPTTLQDGPVVSESPANENSEWIKYLNLS